MTSEGGRGKGVHGKGRNEGEGGGEGVRECKGSYVRVLNFLKLRGIGASSAKGKKASVV